MINRLWVRFSLIIVGTVLLIAFGGFFLRIVVPEPPFVSEIDATLLDIEAAIGRERFLELQNAMLRQAQTQIIGSIIVTGIVSVVMGGVISRWLAAPLQELEVAAGAIQTQQFNVRVPERGSQEIAAVARSFNEMAARLGEAETLRRNLLSDVAHELRHPIHILQGNLQAMLEGVYPLNEDEISRLLSQTSHLKELVNDLHELAQAEARQLPLQREPVAMAQLVKDTTKLFEPRAKEEAIKLQAILEGELPTLSLDRSRFKQVLSNLLSNALQFTPAGGHVTVTLNTGPELVTLAVADSGAGIAPDDLPKIFDRFYRVDGARSREVGHTGLGLAIVKAIVQAHNGEVVVSSPGPGQGSVFTVTLPRATP